MRAQSLEPGRHRNWSPVYVLDDDAAAVAAIA